MIAGFGVMLSVQALPCLAPLLACLLSREGFIDKLIHEDRQWHV